MNRSLAVYMAAILMAVAVSSPAFSQEGDAAEAEEAAPSPTPAQTEQAKPKETSIYGEIKVVNPAANSISIQYYDYDSDEEKTIEVLGGKDTKIENAATLADIKNGDWADVTYTASDGKNVAKTIKVEKELPETSTEPATTEEPEEE